LAGRAHLVTAEACEKYGIVLPFQVVNKGADRQLDPLVRIGPNHIITNDPDVLKNMSAVRSLYRRPIWYKAMRLEPDYDNVICERDENRHSDLCTKMAAGVSRNSIYIRDKSLRDQVFGERKQRS
jgi:hypothetical protein